MRDVLFRQTFVKWVRTHTGQDSLTGQLADGAAVDPDFPKADSPQDVRNHLAIMRADKSWFEAINEAEMNWRQR